MQVAALLVLDRKIHAQVYHICGDWRVIELSTSSSIKLCLCLIILLILGDFRHRWTGRYEAHLWDNSCRREGQSRKGRQGNHTILPIHTPLLM
jgi:hypothetical protein